MKIGIDIDDTLLHSFEDFLDFYNEYHNTNFKKEDNTSDKKFHEFLGITKEELIKFYRIYDQQERSHYLEPIEGAKEVLEKLVSKHEFILITARPNFLAEKTHKIVEKHYSDFKFRIIFNKSNPEGDPSKGEICVKEGIKIMIDDDIDNALDCVKNNVQVILLNKPWNRAEEHTMIKRVNNWGEILEEIKKSGVLSNEC